MMALYLLHFDRSLGTSGRSAANHYLGYASDEGDALIRRVSQHLTGRSDVKIVQAFDRIGAVGRLVSVFWNATHDDERRMKSSGGFARWCPICRAAPDAAEGYYTRRQRRVR
jgi:hypothetical protein